MTAHLPERTSERTISEALEHIGGANHCQAGAVIALNGAFAAALAQATANGSLADGAVGPARDAAESIQRNTAQARARFRSLADQDAAAITTFVELRARGETLRGYETLCDGPRDMAWLAVHATEAMQAYRPFVVERTKDDLEFAIVLMTGVARAALLLLDSNLRIWPLPELIARYAASVEQLAEAASRLHPLSRIR